MIVIGSSNMDLVVRAPRIPVLGETVLGGDFLMVPGGKGANQAVAAAKLGAQVYLVAKLGDDVFGRKLLRNFRREQLDTTHVTLALTAPSGVALITVDEAGNNAIVVAPGANAYLLAEDVCRAEAEIRSAGAVVAQLEVPMAAVRRAAEVAQDSGVPFILDPAPARPLGADVLQMVAVLTPNETEAQLLTGIEVSSEASAEQAAERLLRMGVKAVILTMGSKGYLLADRNERQFVPSLPVEAVDTTAAGDAFTGSLAVGLARGQDVREAARFANRVAALSVTRMGAQPSMPTREELDAFAV